MTIRLASGSEFAEITLKRIFGQPGLGYSRLLLDFFAHIREQAEASRVQLDGFCGELVVRSQDDKSGTVAALHPVCPPLMIESFKGSNTRGFQMEAELDRARVEAIEAIRGGGDLQWTVTLRARAAQQGKLLSVGGSEEMGMVKGQWIEIMKQAGYRRTLLIDVPLTGTRNRNMAKAVKHLESAQDSLMGGDARGASGLCRDALESLSHAVGGDDRTASFDGSASLTKDQRLLVLRRALKLLPHAAKHSEPADASIEWERRDAEMLIAMVAALIRRHTAT